MYYFVSDTHFGMDGALPSKDRERLFVQWLDRIADNATAIFLVGDIFDFWFEYRRVVPKGFTRVLGKLSELTDRGIKVHFFTGNHDMWTFGYLRDECGIEVHEKPEIFDLNGRKVFVAHGDNMYIKKPFLEKIMQGLFHSRAMRWLCRLLVHPDLLMKFGQWWSDRSRKSHVKTHVFCGEREYLVNYAREYRKAVQKFSIDYFVFGHIHCAYKYDMGEGSHAVFLGEWLFNPHYAVLDKQGRLELKPFE